MLENLWVLYWNKEWESTNGESVDKTYFIRIICEWRAKMLGYTEIYRGTEVSEISESIPV